MYNLYLYLHTVTLPNKVYKSALNKWLSTMISQIPTPNGSTKTVVPQTCLKIFIYKKCEIY